MPRSGQVHQHACRRFGTEFLRLGGVRLARENLMQRHQALEFDHLLLLGCRRYDGRCNAALPNTQPFATRQLAHELVIHSDRAAPFAGIEVKLC